MSKRAKIHRGLKILEGGNIIQKLFGNANYDKIDRSYRKRFIQTRQRKDGSRYLWHIDLKKEVTDKDIQQAILKDYTGTETPYKDRRYLDEKAAIKRAEELGKDFKWYDTTVDELGLKIRSKFSKPIYDTEGVLLGSEYELNRQKKIDKRKTNLKKLQDKSSYSEEGSTEQSETTEHTGLNLSIPQIKEVNKVDTIIKNQDIKENNRSNLQVQTTNNADHQPLINVTTPKNKELSIIK